MEIILEGMDAQPLAQSKQTHSVMLGIQAVLSVEMESDKLQEGILKPVMMVIL